MIMRLPSIFSFREHVQAGGLISYGQHLADSYRRAATHVDRIFKGAKLGELPVELSTRLEAPRGVAQGWSGSKIPHQRPR
jgi:putative ABC transport system substrate-binding protein